MSYVKTLEIRKSWYFSAGNIYGWTKDGLETAGVGVNRSWLYGADEVNIKINGRAYVLNCAEARDFIRKYRSVERMPGGSLLGVVSKSLLEEIV